MDETNTHSKKMNDILKQKPSFIVRWGNTWLLVLLLLAAAIWLAGRFLP